MLALLTGYYLAAYLLVPSAIFRTIFAISLPLKKFQRRTEEIAFAVLVCLLPFAFSLFLVSCVGFSRHDPFYVGGTAEERSEDYRVVFGAAYSDKEFTKNPEQFWKSATLVRKREGRVLFWYYVLVALEAGFVRWSLRYFGKIRKNPDKRLNGLYVRGADLFLRSASEWHLILSTFTSPREPKMMVWADILTNQNNLYQGIVWEYYVDLDGKLSGMLLLEPRRFDREGYLRRVTAAGKLSDAEREQLRKDFWRPIPSAKFYFPYSVIQNLNVRHEPVDIGVATTERLEEQQIQLKVEEVMQQQDAVSTDLKGVSGPPPAAGEPPAPPKGEGS